jgi:hypothetical protein
MIHIRSGVVLYIAILIGLPLLASPTLGAASVTTIPDFSGIWGRNWLLLEQPLSGPGPIASKLRKADGTFDFLGGSVGDFTSQILKTEAAQTVRTLGKLELSGKVFPNPHTQCWPEPTPFALGIQFGMQILQEKDEVILLYLADHQVRHVRMNVQHPSNVTPTWKGDSVGHYEGDMLVVDTIGQKIGPLSMVDAFGTPFSPALHVIERYRLIDGTLARDAQQRHESHYFPPGISSPLTNEYGRGDLDPDISKKGLQVQITVEDPAMFTMPWSGVVTYRHVLGDWPEAVCAENTREFGSDRTPPMADKPDF